MSSTILADNGVSSGSAGLKTTADSSGSLVLQTSTGSGTATTALTIDTSQNATFAGSVKTNTLTSASATALTLQSAGTTAITVDTSQNLLVGTSTVAGSSPSLNIGPANAGATSTLIALQNRSTSNNSGVQISFRGLTSTGADSDYGYITMVANDTTAKNSYMSFTTTSGGTPSERMRIDSSGRVTTPYQPMFHIYSSASSMSSGTKVAFNSVGINVGSYFDATTNYRFNAPVAGTYYFSAVVRYNILGTTYDQTTILVNNTVVFQGHYSNSTAQGSGYTSTPAVALITLSAGDFVHVTADISGGGSISFSGSESSFIGFLVG